MAIIAGAVFGTVIGVSIASGIAAWSQWQNPGDASAGSVAIVGIFTAPAGLFLGGFIGAFCGLRWM